MQTTHSKAVRYYIDREADTPIIRTVPVARPAATSGAPEPRQETVTATETTNPRHETRHRLTGIVQAGVRKYRHHNS